MPTNPGSLCAIDLFGSLPTSKGGVRHILVCLDVFSKYIKLYPLKSATTRACLNKLINHYFNNITKPEVILSDHGTQFTSPSWKGNMAAHGVKVRYSAVRHPQSNPSERFMREIAKFCKIYCHENHRKWAELIPYIERWINTTVATSTGFAPVELMMKADKPNLFEGLVPEISEEDQIAEDTSSKIARAHAKMKKGARERKKKKKRGNASWNPKLHEKVLLRTQPVSGAVEGITSKFAHLYEGPYIISKVTPPSTYELSNLDGSIRGEFNKKLLKPYKESIAETRDMTK